MQITSRLTPLFLLLLSILLAQGCAPVIKPDQAKVGEPPERVHINTLLEAGEYGAAAAIVEALAATRTSPEQEALRLEAGELWGRAGEWERVESAIADIFDRALALGGTLSGEHGTGIAKASFLEKETGMATIVYSQRIKNALDPNHILNPGKIIASI